MKAPRSRTQLIRDVALATGKTCIACGAQAVTRVGDYLTCERHRRTVHAPDPRQRWKKNVRDRHQRIRTRGKVCQQCGRKGNLTRHHDWASGTPGHPPRPVILCKRCHASVQQDWQSRNPSHRLHVTRFRGGHGKVQAVQPVA